LGFFFWGGGGDFFFPKTGGPPGKIPAVGVPKAFPQRGAGGPGGRGLSRGCFFSPPGGCWWGPPPPTFRPFRIQPFSPPKNPFSKGPVGAPWGAPQPFPKKNLPKRGSLPGRKPFAVGPAGKKGGPPPPNPPLVFPPPVGLLGRSPKPVGIDFPGLFFPQFRPPRGPPVFFFFGPFWGPGWKKGRAQKGAQKTNFFPRLFFRVFFLDGGQKNPKNFEKKGWAGWLPGGWGGGNKSALRDFKGAALRRGPRKFPRMRLFFFFNFRPEGGRLFPGGPTRGGLRGGTGGGESFFFFFSPPQGFFFQRGLVSLGAMGGGAKKRFLPGPGKGFGGGGWAPAGPGPRGIIFSQGLFFF